MKTNAICRSTVALFVVCQVCHADPANARRSAFAFAAPGVSSPVRSASGCGSAVVVRVPVTLGGDGGTGTVVQPPPVSSGCALSLDGIAIARAPVRNAAMSAIVVASGPYAVLNRNPAFASSVVMESEAGAVRNANGASMPGPEGASGPQPVAPADAVSPPSSAPQTFVRDPGDIGSLLSGFIGRLAIRPSPTVLYHAVLATLAFVIVLSLAVFASVMTIVVRKRYFTPCAVIARAAARGMKRGQFHLEYQPVFHVGTPRCYGVEVLLLWRDSVYGRRGADWFMAQLENSPVVTQLLRFMLETATADLNATEAGRSLQIIVNVPAACIADSGCAALIAQFAQSLSAERVVLQVSCEALRYTRDSLRRLQNDGFRVSLCDVRSPADAAGMARSGTLQFAKLHREIMMLSEAPRNQTLSGFAAWGREYGVPIVADGIDVVGQYQAAGRAQIALAQGFFLCKALDPGRLLTFLDRLTWKQSRYPSSDPRFA